GAPGVGTRSETRRDSSPAAQPAGASPRPRGAAGARRRPAESRVERRENRRAGRPLVARLAGPLAAAECDDSRGAVALLSRRSDRPLLAFGRVAKNASRLSTETHGTSALTYAEVPLHRRSC